MMNSTNEPEKLFLAIPLGVIRRFVKMNEDKEDSWAQLFEITPQNMFFESELKQNGTLEQRGSVVVDLEKLYGGQDDKQGTIT